MEIFQGGRAFICTFVMKTAGTEYESTHGRKYKVFLFTCLPKYLVRNNLFSAGIYRGYTECGGGHHTRTRHCTWPGIVHRMHN